MSAVKQVLIRNTLFNVLGRLAGRFINFLLIPFILFYLGKAEFALFSLLGVFAQYANLADLGTGASLIRYLAVDAAAGDMPSLGRRVLGQVLFGLALTLALAAIFFVAGPFLLAALRLPAADIPDMQWLLMVFVVSMGLGMITNAFGSVLLGFQRMDWSNALGMVLAISNALGTIFFLRLGWGLAGLACMVFINQILGLLLTLALLRCLYPRLQWAGQMPRAKDFRQTVRLGLQLQCLRISSTFTKTLDQLLLAPMLGLGAVTTYALASKPVLVAQEMGALIVSATVPMVAQWDSARDERRIQKLRKHTQRYMALYVGAAIAGFFVLGSWFTRLWLGSGYDDVASIMKMLALGHLISLLTTPGVNELWGRGSMGLPLRIALGQTALYAGGCWLGIKTLGLWGPGAALGLTGMTATAAFFLFFRRARGRR